MRRISRRAMLATTGLGALSAGLPTAWAGNPGQSSAAQENGAHSQKCSLPLTDYQPESMLHVQTTHVSRSTYIPQVEVRKSAQLSDFRIRSFVDFQRR